MEKIYINVSSNQRDDYLSLYQAFGYILLNERPINAKDVQLSFMRNINNPLKKCFRILQKRYYRTKRLSTLLPFLRCLFLGILSLAIGLLFYFFPNIYPEANPIVFHPAFYISFFSVSGVLFLISLILFFAHFSYKKDLPYVIHSVKEDGYELLRIRKRIPKDEFIDKRGIHYHYIHDHYQNS